MMGKFVIVYLVAACLSAREASGMQRYSARRQRGLCNNQSHMASLTRGARCRPVSQPVAVPIPEGYEFVSPAVVLGTRCEGMACYPNSYSCLPDPNAIKNQSIPVYAHTNGRRTCMEVQVEVHEGCLCGCDKTCPPNQVLNKEQCTCECDPSQQRKCEVLQRLFDPLSCECVCPFSQVSQCSSGDVFIKELCRCESY